MKQIRRCQLCREEALVEVLNLGLQPVSNRFRHDREAEQAKFPLDLVQCQACGLVQLLSPVAANQLTAPFTWLSYNEPEGHLDRLAEQIIAHLPPDETRPIWGLSFKDDTLLSRLSSRGFGTYRLNPASDLEIDQPGAGVELIQERLERSRVKFLFSAHGKPRMIVARHILEHVHDLHRFMQVMKELLEPDGVLVVEVPDCEPSFRQFDYTIVWEEHVTYHSKGTLPQVFAVAGMELLDMEVLPLGHESLLVAIGRAGEPHKSEPDRTQVQTELELLTAFRTQFPSIRARFAGAMADHARQDQKVALLGAGHLACAFVNYLGLEQYIAFVVDDNPNKQGLYLPGTRLVIRGSAALIEENVGLCLLSVNPEIEQKVIDRQHAFVERGGRFASIFTGSARALV